MKVDIYKASKRPSPEATLYVFVRAGEDPHKVLPAQERERLGGLSQMKSIDLKEGQKRFGLDVPRALQALNEEGYHVQSTEFIIQFSRKSA
ncbi:MAG: YcgL domain-containing protein [Pseudomonadota bacterium]